jgi:hypothetical protein
LAGNRYANIYIVYRLPLSLRTVDELLEDGDNLGEGSKISLEVGLDLLGVLAELGIEVLSVGDGGHGGAEDRLDDEAVVGLQGVAVGSAERVSKLLRGVGDVALKGLAGEVKATDEPEAALGGSVLASLELVTDKVLDGAGLSRSGSLAGTELLDVAKDILLDGTESHTTNGIEDGGQGLGGLEELSGRDSLAVGLIDGNVDERSLKRLHNSASRGVSSVRHDD